MKVVDIPSRDPLVKIERFLAMREANGDLGRLAATGHPEDPNRADLKAEWIEEIVEEVKALRSEVIETHELLTYIFDAIQNGDEIDLDWEEIEL